MENKAENSSTPETQTTPQEVTQQPAQMSEVPKQKSWVVINLVILVLLLLGITGFFAYQNYQLKKKVSTQPSRSPTTSVPTPTTTLPNPTTIQSTPTTDSTTTWQNHTNEEYKFNFKYPKNYTFEEMPVPTSKYVQVIFNVGQENGFTFRARKDYLPNDVTYFLDTPSNGQREIGENVWLTYFIPASENTRVIYGFQLERNNILYSLSFPNGIEPTSEQLEVVSTIKLL